jgi:hypothetical protein
MTLANFSGFNAFGDALSTCEQVISNPNLCPFADALNFHFH